MSATDDAPPRRRLAFISHVLPYPGDAGQQQRVRYLLAALREQFHVTFVTSDRLLPDAAELSEHVDEVVLVDTRRPTRARRAWWAAAGSTFVVRTGLKRSNYAISRIDLPRAALEPVAATGAFDLAVFQYWHASDAVVAFQRHGAPAVLDMHDILWRSREAQLAMRGLPGAALRLLVRRYRRREEAAWAAYDAIIAINREEQREVQALLPGTPVLYGPMGVDLDAWPQRWQRPAQPSVAFYGGLGSARGERDALRCYERVMPEVWAAVPDATFVVIGSKPGPRITALRADPRVRVLGFVPDVGQALAAVSVVVCPFEGTYGFRSRLVEVMATGTPLVTTPDAVHGMEITEADGVALRADDAGMASAAVRLLLDGAAAARASAGARAHAVATFGVAETYTRLVHELATQQATGRAGASGSRTPRSAVGAGRRAARAAPR